MEHGARLSTQRVIAIGFIAMGVVILGSITTNVIQAVNNYRLQNEQKSIVTPMLFNAPFAVSQNQADASYRLSNGRQINLADWKVVLFMQGHCPYCHQFDPVLKSLSARVGFGVMAYTIDGQGDASFPDALPAPPEVMKTFFPNLPVATPTTFLVNVNTLEALPLLQGATDEQGFMARMDTVLQMRGVGNNG